MKFSIFGSRGFIGSNLVDFLKKENFDFELFEPEDKEIFQKKLGHVIYCIGITSDFRERPFDTVESHVCILHKILKECKFDSLLYLSSSRIYLDAKSTNEDDFLQVNPKKFDNIYNISKLMGEALCNISSKPNVRIARLSNVVGNNHDFKDFLPSIIHDAIIKKKIMLHMKSSSAKDYIYIDDVVKMLTKIATEGKEKTYNIGYGKNTKIQEIIEKLNNIIDFETNYADDAFEQIFPEIDVSRIKNEFNFEPISFLEKLNEMVTFQKNLHS